MVGSEIAERLVRTIQRLTARSLERSAILWCHPAVFGIAANSEFSKLALQGPSVGAGYSCVGILNSWAFKSVSYMVRVPMLITGPAFHVKFAFRIAICAT